MNGGTFRGLAAEAAIGVSLCAGAYLMLVEPVEARITEARQRLATLDQAPAPAPLGANAVGAAQVRDAMRKLVVERSRTATDEAAMFEAVMEAAAKHRVRVDQLQPSALRAAKRADPAPGAPAEAVGEGKVGQMRGYTLVVAGTYAGIASFVQSLQHDIGLARVRAVRMAVDNRPGSDLVLATIETDHLAVTVNQAAAATQGGMGGLQ